MRESDAYVVALRLNAILQETGYSLDATVEGDIILHNDAGPAYEVDLNCKPSEVEVVEW